MPSPLPATVNCHCHVVDTTVVPESPPTLTPVARLANYPSARHISANNLLPGHGTTPAHCPPRCRAPSVASHLHQWWDTLQPHAWDMMLRALLHGSSWPAITLTNKAKAAKHTVAAPDGPFPETTIRHWTTVDEIKALIPLVRWDNFQTWLDAWCGDNAIRDTLRTHNDRQRLRIFTNDIDTCTTTNDHNDALLQPGQWNRWMYAWKPQFVICSLLFSLMDLAVPLMMWFCPVLFVHVPSTWICSATATRSRWLQSQKDAGRLQIITNMPRGNAGPWRCCRLVIIKDAHDRKQVMRNKDDFIL